MDLDFEVGDSQAPLGHALIYFTSTTAGDVFATYVQTFPIPMNLSQYMPPAFASLMPAEQMETQSAAVPPVVQPVEQGLAWLRALAESRKDDLVNAGMLYSTDQVNLMSMTQEAAGTYAELYRSRAEIVAASPIEISRHADLTDAERLQEMTKLVGLLRDSLGTPDAEPVKQELRELAAILPSKYRVDELMEWASTPGETGQQLATLHLQRSYKLLNEEYLDVADIERQIRELQTP
jgi:hypothetical protein